MILRYIFSRIVKLLANLLKLFCMLHIRLFPKARFTIPADAPALIRRTSQRAIPRAVYQTNYSPRVTLAVYLAYLCNRLMAADHSFHFFDDDRAEAYVAEHFSGDVLETYQRLQIGAAKADYWRVLLLAKDGGTYVDVDANFVWPLSWTQAPDQTELFLYVSNNSITNYFLASAPGNPIFEEIAQIVGQNITGNVSDNVYVLTGPDAMKPVLAGREFATESYRVVCHQGQFTNERLQYPDKAHRKWWREQEDTSILR